MFLGIDHHVEAIYYLTNKKFANLDNTDKDPVEARISSPPLVKMITMKQITELRHLKDNLEQEGSHNSSSEEPNDKGGSSEANKTYKQKVREILE